MINSSSDSISDLLIESCIGDDSPLGAMFAFGGFVLPMVVWFLSPNKLITVKWLLAYFILSLFFMMILLRAINISINRTNLPSIIRASPYEDEDIPVNTPMAEDFDVPICLLEKSDWFSQGMLVSFYYQGDDGFERLIGLGRVRNIQEDGKVQVVLTDPIEAQIETVRSLSNDEPNAVQNTLVKPGAPYGRVPL